MSRLTHLVNKDQMEQIFDILFIMQHHFNHAQIRLMDAKRQLETQVALQQKTKELLNTAELELNTLRLQQGSSEARHPLSSPSTPILRG